MRSRRVVMAVTVAVVAVLLAGCSAVQNQDTAASPTLSHDTPSPTATIAPLQQWESARAFLAAQTIPSEVHCGLVDVSDGTMVWLDEPVEFFSFTSDPSRWAPDLRSRVDPPSPRVRFCIINVPTSVPYTTPGIEGFLNPMGYWFRDSSPAAGTGLRRVEIAYAGDAGDPDSPYAQAPGLWALWLALSPIHDIAQDASGAIVEPTSDAVAAEYLRYSANLLEWYGYSG